MIGWNYGDDEITLSGLLGLSHQLGLRGLGVWAADKEGVKEGKYEGEAFDATNGRF